MVHVITAYGVNDALHAAANWLHVAGVWEDSRNGRVLAAPAPVCTVYKEPQQRVLSHPTRDANPFFHFFESLWMLGGRNDVAFVSQFVKRMETFSDNGVTLNGAYGHRWRSHFWCDQIMEVVNELRRNPASRRCVVSMWDGLSDLTNQQSKDLPCNTHIYFDCRGGVLNMTVCNRSNDAIWGCYGANMVHMSMLQEYVSMHLGSDVGEYRQFSNNLHVYESLPNFDQLMFDLRTTYYDKYELPITEGGVFVQNFLNASENAEWWDEDLYAFLEDPFGDKLYKTNYFNSVVAPLANAWQAHKSGDGLSALACAACCTATDWQTAAVEWLNRRAARRMKNEL